MGAGHGIQQDPPDTYLQIEQLKSVNSAQGKTSTQAGFGQLRRTTWLMKRDLAIFIPYGGHTTGLNSPIPVPGIPIFPIPLEITSSKNT